MKGEVKYKAGTILTDGTVLIHLAFADAPTWTPCNNYGKKWVTYWGCTAWPKRNGPYVGNHHVFSSVRSDEIPALWLQPNHELGHFRPISKKLIEPKILKHLGL